MSEDQQVKSESGKEFSRDLAEAWQSLPDKPAFFLLLTAWLALFHFLGNSTFGYVDTPSLLKWMFNVYAAPGSEDAHGQLVPFAVLGLFWWKRKELIPLAKSTWWPGLLILAFASLLHVVGYVIQQPRFSVLGFFLGIYGLLGLVWGSPFMKSSFFPFVLFVFCVPIGALAETVTFPLRQVASAMAAFVGKQVLAINVTRMGTQLFGVTPEGPFQYDVAPACSGIHSLISLVALTTIYGFVNFKKPWKRWAVVASALPLALAANVLRLLMIIIAADSFGENAGNYVHNSAWLSLLPYVPAFAMMLVIGHWLREESSDPAVEIKPA
jgi:exosortase